VGDNGRRYLLRGSFFCPFLHLVTSESSLRVVVTRVYTNVVLSY
jgi:hypothetical protein